MTDSNPPDDDPFAEFEDWLVDGPAGKWPGEFHYGSSTDPRSIKQIQIAANNARLLQNPIEWQEKVEQFESQLSSKCGEEYVENTRLKYEIRLDGIDVKGSIISFSRYNFPCSVSFKAASFQGQLIDFSESNFANGRIDFTAVDFGLCAVNFSNCKFRKGELDFNRAKFGLGDVYFFDTDLSKAKLLFMNCTVEGAVLFSDSTINSASFSGTTIRGPFYWSSGVFSRIPDFRYVKLDQPPEVARIEVPPPELERCRARDGHLYDDRTYRWRFPFKCAANADDVDKIRKLKAMALAANDHEKDGEFFAYEMMAKRGTEHTTFWQLLFNTIYWKVSFYGQSYLRPLGWLAGSFATFAAIYSLMAALPIGGWQSLAFGITYSFKNSLPFLGTLTRSVPSSEGHVSWFALQLQAIKDAQPGPDWFTVLGTGQAMLSLFFFFFLLLGLRNKFRLK